MVPIGIFSKPYGLSDITGGQRKLSACYIGGTKGNLRLCGGKKELTVRRKVEKEKIPDKVEAVG